MKRKVLSVTISLLCLGSVTMPAQAQSQNECSIWLCLPGGFPAGCGAAYSAMVKRLEDFKPPLPDFGSCSAKTPQGNQSKMTFSVTPSALVPKQKVCTQWSDLGDSNQQCLASKEVPEHYVEGTPCQVISSGDEAYPPGCTKSVKSIKVFIDGKQAGTTFRW